MAEQPRLFFPSIFWQLRASPDSGRLARVLIAGAIIAAGVGLRIWLASGFPVVNDEQAYVYDAVLFEPGRAFFWKSPILITLEHFWVSVFPLSAVLVPRLMIVVTSTFAMLALAWCARRIAGVWAGWGTLIVGMVFPGSLEHSILVLSEHLLLLFTALTCAVTLKWRNRPRLAVWQLLTLSGMVGLATLTRHSGVFWFLAAALLLRTRNVKEMSRRVVWMIVPYAVAVAVFFGMFREIAKGYRFAGLFFRFFEDSFRGGYFNKALDWFAVFPRFLPLLMAWLLGLGERSWRQGWLKYGIVILLGWTWMGAFQAPAHANFVLLCSLILLGMGLRKVYSGAQWLDVAAFLIPPVLAYAVFEKVNEKYLAEFLPAFIMAAGLGLGRVLDSLRIRRTQVPALAALVLLGWAIWPWYRYAVDQPYVGTVTVAAVQEAAGYIRGQIAPEDTIVTGAVLVPLLAGRQESFHIPHPSWYGPTFRGKEEPRFWQMLDPVADALEAGEVEYLLEEKLTTDTYRKHPRIDAAFDEDFVLVAEFGDEYSSPIRILQHRSGTID